MAVLLSPTVIREDSAPRTLLPASRVTAPPFQILDGAMLKEIAYFLSLDVKNPYQVKNQRRHADFLNKILLSWVQSSADRPPSSKIALIEFFLDA